MGSNHFNHQITGSYASLLVMAIWKYSFYTSHVSIPFCPAVFVDG